MPANTKTVKVVLLGDAGVGKSSLALRFVSNEFRPYTESTIGASFMSKTMEVSCDGGENIDQREPKPSVLQKVTFKIWDTAGQEKYHSLAPMYYRGAAVAILVYDICSHVSFDVLTRWVEELRQQGPEDIVLAVCGNKSDLGDHRQVESDSAREYAEGAGAFYIETSARNNVNVKEMFNEIGIRVQRIGLAPSPSELSDIDNGQIDLGYIEENRGFLSCC
eukprot:CAMPEP_0183303058 /NCGR_PEP_ID=MMETSP0160_2-20130417/8637_1 /TAXON_ID=2839 ORGANISM="Odontella Sinensis, Strain Grunow 1884" /NCGR_SAMPLE_ID=MMETSP0160_2 /ASSEMBLY_ACC=CAM_ASM_000250 /LENGTH=219 /DNA_ID=CAMNT_0025465913 /DNA_START=251 /DNA_END=910 /DNA_ORIENTATION=+